MSDFFRNLVDDLKDEDTNIMGDGKGSAEYSGTVDSGSYMLNAVLSGSIFGGVPNNKITALCVFKKNKKKIIGLIHMHNILNANII